MKRFTRRLIAVILGLCLGWYAAAEGPTWFNPEPGYAHGDHPTPAEGGETSAKEGDAKGHGSADHLVPEREDASFMGMVLWIGVALVASAVVVGVFLRALGEEDPGVQASADDAREAHHDDHGHDNDHGHGEEKGDSH